jgi:Transposase DDE domain group 1
LKYVYGYSFFLTSRPVDTDERLAETEHWYRHRTDIEALNKDAKIGAALRHLPSGDKTVNTLWMWAALLACNISAWTQETTGIDRGNGRGRRTVARIRRELIAIPARIIHHAGQRILRLPPGHWLLPSVLTRLQTLPSLPG